jgi:hypothetical protein
MRRELTMQGVFWMLVYVLLAVAPLILLTIGELPPGREFWRELSVALGFAGLSMLALQFVLTARFRRIKAPYGADVVYHFHRQISLVSLALILCHPLLLFVNSPDTLALLNLLAAPWRARFGVLAVVLMLILIAASLWRRRLSMGYTGWRIWHGILATAVVALAMAHVVLARHYLNTPLKQALWIGYGAFWIGLLVYVRLVKPLALQRRPYRVVRVDPERGGRGAWWSRRTAIPACASCPDSSPGSPPAPRPSPRPSTRFRSPPARPTPRHSPSPSRNWATSHARSRRCNPASRCTSTGRTATSVSTASPTPRSMSSSPAAWGSRPS